MSFIGAPYPITKTPLGFFSPQSRTGQIKSDLLMLLLTNPGERVMLPNFGTPLRKLLFNLNDSVVAEEAQQIITEAIRVWEPRITIQAIEVETQGDNANLNENDLRQDLPYILSIKIVFLDPENIKDVQELNLQLPLSGE